jgi:hypothetical protein
MHHNQHRDHQGRPEGTGREHAMADMIDDHTLAEGWFEPCGEHTGEDLDGRCSHCGWLSVDHTAGLAVVFAVTPLPAAAPLRRAS